MAHSTLQQTFDTENLSTADRPAPLSGSIATISSLPSASQLLLILMLWAAIYVASLFAPPLLDDADATHASAARHMLVSGDYTTLTVNGIRYLEKAPLPYWLVAGSMWIFGFNTFAVHLPTAVCVLLLSLVGYVWARRAWPDSGSSSGDAAFYTAVATLTSAGVFLFTRTFIPEVLLSFLLALTLFTFLSGLEAQDSAVRCRYMYAGWAAMALAVLTKGLVAIVFPGTALLLYLCITGDWRRWRELRLVTGSLLFVAIAAPWHILAGLRNTGGDHGNGFFWFYFINEHLLRFLGRRLPHDYNKLPGYLYWTLHLVWLFPWSLFWPTAVLSWWRNRQNTLTVRTYGSRSQLLLTIYTGFLLLFFAISTNQEYYTFPAYLPLLLLTVAGLVSAEQMYSKDGLLRRSLLGAHLVLTLLGLSISAALAAGLWSSRQLPFVADIGSLLAHRGVGGYTLSMSHFFDLTGASFAALRLPAALAAVAFAVGPLLSWRLRLRQRHFAATTTLAITASTFLIAAHIALVRFGPMLSSADMAFKVQKLSASHAVASDTEVMLYGDQAYGSSIPFYTGRTLRLVEGRSTSMWFGSTFPDAPLIFLTNNDLSSVWGTGPRKILFVPLEKRDAVDAVLGPRQILLMEQSGKALITDRPLERTR